MTTDPYGQYSSPYLGMGNDPINGVDPDGGFVHIIAGIIIGGGAEVISQGIGNLAQGNSFFSNLDYADIAISAGEGGLIAATGGAAGGLTLAGEIAIAGTGAILKSTIDYNNGEFKTINNGKSLNDVGKDLVGNIVGFGIGKALPIGGTVDSFLSKNTTGRAGKVISTYFGSRTDAILGGLVGVGSNYLYDSAASLFKNKSETNKDINSTIHVQLKAIHLSSKRSKIKTGDIMERIQNKGYRFK